MARPAIAVALPARNAPVSAELRARVPVARRAPDELEAMLAIARVAVASSTGTTSTRRCNTDCARAAGHASWGVGGALAKRITTRWREDEYFTRPYSDESQRCVEHSSAADVDALGPVLRAATRPRRAQRAHTGDRHKRERRQTTSPQLARCCERVASSCAGRADRWGHVRARHRRRPHAGRQLAR